MSTVEEAKQQPIAPATPVVKGYENVTITEVPPSGEPVKFTKTFHVDYMDPDTGVHQVGTFVASRATIGMLAEIGVTTARLNGGVEPDSQTRFLNSMRAYCAVVLTTTPPWWDLDTSYDFQLLATVYDYTFAWEGSFRRKALEQRRR